MNARGSIPQLRKPGRPWSLHYFDGPAKSPDPGTREIFETAQKLRVEHH
jgi:hypothetical protein